MEDLSVVIVAIVLCGFTRVSLGIPETSDCEASGSCMDSPWNLVFLQGNSVRYLTISNNSTISDIYNNDEHRPVCLTTNIRDNVVYWTDQDANGLPAIYRSPITAKSKNSAEIFVDAGIYEPRGLAFDWVTQNLYFVDSKVSQIIVCPTIAPTRCAVVLTEKIGKPYTIALDPNQGLMFWTNEKYPAIRRAKMDGSSAVTLISTDIQLPKAIAVDQTRVFWSDYGQETIESVQYDGTDRRILAKSACSFGMGILGQSIYWSYPYEHESVLQKANKENGENKTHLLDRLLGESDVVNVTDISLMHISAQPIARNNSCAYKTCSHICALSGSDDAVCMCPVGLTLNGTSCSVSSLAPKIFVAQQATLLTMQVGTIGTDVFQKIPLPSEIKNINALVYNSMNESVILYDRISKKIFNFKPDSNELEVLVDKDISNVVSMDIDILSHNLFWLDAGKKQVELFSLKSRSRLVIYKNVQNGHQVVNDLGTIYVAKRGYSGQQEVSAVSLEVPVSDMLVQTFSGDLPPVQMTCDPATHMLVIASSNRTHVTMQSEYTANHDYIGFGVNLKGRPVEAMTKIGNRIFWVDGTNKMKAFTPVEILDGKYLLDRIQINDEGINNKFKKLIAFYPGSQYLKEFMANFEFHLCSLGTAYCPHFCIPKLNHITDGACWCETGYEVESYKYGARHTKCVEANSSGINAYNLRQGLEASDFAEIFTSKVNDNGGSGGWFWVSITLSLIVVLLCGVVGYMVWYWRKTRSIPLIIKPFFRNEE